MEYFIAQSDPKGRDRLGRYGAFGNGNGNDAGI